MTQRMAGIVGAASGCLLLVSIVHGPASACACCSNRGSRYVATETLDPQRMVQIDEMVLGKKAQPARKRHSLGHDPENACPGLDPGWKPVFGMDHAQALR
jgi:hypothetical protein